MECYKLIQVKFSLNLHQIKKQSVSHIIISKGTEFLRIPQDKLVYISSDANYSHVVTLDNRRHLVSFQLGQIEDIIGEQLGDKGSNFVRVGRKLIINTDYLFSIDVTKQILILSDCAGCYHELNASREVLIKMKAYFETLMTLNNE